MAQRIPSLIAAVCAASLLVGCDATQQIGINALTPSAASTTHKLNRAIAGKLASQCPCVYVTNPAGGNPSITVYPSSATGNVAPIQTISGRRTLLNNPHAIALDPSSNIYVADLTNNRVLVYSAGSTGNVAPIQNISGPNTGLSGIFAIAVNPANGDIYVGSEGTSSNPCANDVCVQIFAPGANGDAAPIATIAGSNTELNNIEALAFDSVGDLYVANAFGGPSYNGIITVYAAGSVGNVTPMQSIEGPKTKLVMPVGVAVDSSSNIYALNYSGSHGSNGSIVVFASGGTGNISPMRRIAGQRTKLVGSGIAVNGAGDAYVVSSEAEIFKKFSDWVAVYAAGANGNVAPTNEIAGKKTKLTGPIGIAIH